MIVRVRGGGMAPLLRHGDLLWTSRYRRRAPARGQLVAFRGPRAHRGVFVRRLIGLPGENVQVRQSRVSVDREMLNEPYLISAKALQPIEDGVWRLGPGEYFVMCDVRGDMEDSRWMGPVKKGQIIGQVRLRFWPPTRPRRFPVHGV